MIKKKKFLSLVVCLMVVGLMASLISGCTGDGGNGGNGGDGGDDTPQYGGELVTMVAADPIGFDDAIQAHYTTTSSCECLWSGDWAKGLAGGYGSGDTDWELAGDLNRLSNDTGYLAESYEIYDDHIIFHLRDGVHWQDKYPCDGRELTADDVVFSLERQRTLSTAYLAKNYPQTAAVTSISKVDEDTVRVDCAADQMPNLLTLIDFMYILPQDVIETFGDMEDPNNNVSSGAFFLDEYVPSSHVLWERNPDYWRTNPVGPGEGDQLPYLDSVRTLIQPDMATQDSLFRTGQVDINTGLDHDRWAELKDEEGVNYVSYFVGNGGRVLHFRLDKTDKPYADVRVRQAMQLAIDNQKILDQLYSGDGEVLYWPVYYNKAYAGAFVGLDELDDVMIEVGEDTPTEISVADLWGYNLELAQALMAEAGYPDGFEAQVDVYNYYIDMDTLQVMVDMLEDIGIELTINAVDYATISMTWYTGNFPDMFYGSFSGIGTYFKGINWSGVGMFNASNIDDPKLNDYRDQMLAAYPDESAVDVIHAEMIPYLLEQCYVVQSACPRLYRMWWDWVKNFSGEGSIGYYKAINPGMRDSFLWIDEDLKESMGY
jgi:peptide/nickel transport system substrate-binding protein